MELNGYLNRIGYNGPIQPTLECLIGIHRCQALSVPYENIDVQLGYPIDQNIERIYEKIVTQRRGGWCYELNGLLQWGLDQIGFNVMRVTGGVHQREDGDSAAGNHLALLVNLDRIYLADLGLGDGIREPIPLEPGSYLQGELEFEVDRLSNDCWRIFNHSFGYPRDYDLLARPADEARLLAHEKYLQTSPESSFVLNFDCELMQENSITCLTGRVLRQKTANGTARTLIQSVAEMTDVLDQVFDIRGVDLSPAWPGILHRHATLFGDQPIDQVEDIDA